MYKLEKPYVKKQKYDFIVEYGSSGKGLEIEETDLALYALEPWETLKGDEVIENKEQWEIEQTQKEKERVAMLSLTRGDVFRGLLMAKQVTRTQIRTMIETNENLSIIEKEMALIDFDEALNFYRGNALIDTLGLSLGITSQQLDKFFETNDYKVLLPVEDEVIEDDTTI